MKQTLRRKEGCVDAVSQKRNPEMAQRGPGPPGQGSAFPEGGNQRGPGPAQARAAVVPGTALPCGAA